VTRNAGATLFVPSEDEWYKAAYYDPTSSSYFDVPTGSNGVPNCSAPTASANSGNCSNNWEGGYISSGLTNVGSYPGSPSPYGTFDQGGNVAEWNEALIHVISGYTGRSIRGGPFDSAYYDFAAIRSYPTQGWVSNSGFGFRLALIPGGFVPEPGTGGLVLTGLLGLAGWRRARA
jgi:formylglycine-generating enzyme required for sulfatase activity